MAARCDAGVDSKDAHAPVLFACELVGSSPLQEEKETYQKYVGCCASLMHCALPRLVLLVALYIHLKYCYLLAYAALPSVRHTARPLAGEYCCLPLLAPPIATCASFSFK